MTANELAALSRAALVRLQRETLTQLRRAELFGDPRQLPELAAVEAARGRLSAIENRLRELAKGEPTTRAQPWRGRVIHHAGQLSPELCAFRCIDTDASTEPFTPEQTEGER